MGLPSAVAVAGSATRPLRRTPARAWRLVSATGDSLVGAPRRTVRYCMRTWFDWADRRHRAGPPPIPRPGLALAAEASLDEAVLLVFKLANRPSPPAVVRRILHEGRAALERYEDLGWLDAPSRAFPEPPPMAGPQWSRRRLGRLAYEHLTFASDYEPGDGEPGRQRWLGYSANRTAHAWVLRHREPRPWLVCLHGSVMGTPFTDLTAFRAGWMHQELGLNLAFPVQPLHGPRRQGVPSQAKLFPTDDLLDTVHGVGQAVWDTRRLIGWIRSHEHDVVGVTGLSLGGYTTALLTGLDDRLACVIAGIPAVDFGDLLLRHAPAGFFHRADYRALTELGVRVHRVISPLALAPRVPRERRFIYAGLADRLVSPGTQVRALWAHWDQPRTSWFGGGHVGFLWSAPVRAFVAEALAESGLVDADRRGAPGGRPRS